MNGKLLITGIGLILIAGAAWLFFPQQSSEPDTIATVTATPSEDQLSTNSSQESRYLTYSQESFIAAKDKKRVIFFHASWCPTCKAANAAFTTNPNAIPEGVVLFKTDYDTYGDLKKKYAITYQHTYVQVDEDGNQITKWNGGDIDSLNTNLK